MISLEGLTWLDGLWITLVAMLTLRGFFRGFFKELLEILGLGASVYVAARLYDPLSRWLLDRIGGIPAEAARAAAFGLVAAGVMALSVVLGGMVAHLARISPLSWADTLGGLVLGAAKGVLVVAVLVTLLAGLPAGDLRDTLNRSVISDRVQGLVPGVWQMVRQAFPQLLPPLPALEEKTGRSGRIEVRRAAPVAGGGPL